MWRVSIRNLIGHKMRLLTTSIAIVIGVAFLAGTLVLKDTMKRTFDDLFSGVYAHTDAVVRAKGQFDDPSGFGTQRGRIDESLLASVQHVNGVAAAQPEVSGYAQIVDKKGDPVGQPQNGPPVVGTNWPAVDQMNPWTLVSGRPPAADDEVVIDKKSAEVTGYKPGDTAMVLVMGPPQTMRVVGVAEYGGAGGSTGGATFAIFTTTAAQRLVGQAGKLDAISVVASPGVSQRELVGRLRSAMPGGTESLTGAAIIKESQDTIQKGMSVFNTFMLVFAFVAMFVGAFIVFNTFFITIAQRTRENALLRAIGASRPQILGSVVIEAFFVGLVASLIGLAGGVLVAAGLKALLSALGFDLPVMGIVFTTRTAVVSLLAGMVVTVGAAMSPARKAGKVPPVAAMQDVTASSSGYGSKERIIVGSAVVVTGVAALLYGLFGHPDNALSIVGLAALLVFFGVTVLGRTVALPLSRVIGAPLPRARGITGRLAKQNAMRNPKRTAATASALMIGVGLVSFITIFAASTKASISSVIDQKFLGDFAVTSPAMAGNGGLDPALVQRLGKLPEVDVAGAIRMKAAQVAGTPVQLPAADAGAFEIFNVDPLQGRPADLGADAIGVYKDMAEKKGLKIGDKVPVVFPATGAHELTVSMIYGENMPAGNWIIGMQAYDKLVPERYDFQLFVRKAAGVPAATAKAAVASVVHEYPGAKLLDQTEYKAEQSKFVNQMLGLIYALLALAIIIALLGIGNTLALSILERIRELGVLRAVGMTRPQLRSTVRWESVIIAVQGTALGLVVGVFFGWALVRAMADQGIKIFSVPIVNLAIIVLLGALAGVVASVMPARRAAKIDVLRAVVSD